MTHSRTPRERLDALLAGIEDEVLRPGRTGPDILDQGGAVEDVGTMRSSIEALIEVRMGSGEDTGGARAKVTQAMERLGRWTGVVQGGNRSGALPQARMAFSGDPSEELGKTARKGTRRRDAGSDSTGRKDD